VISLDLAARLARTGVPWAPTAGDRFVVLDRDLDDQVFTLSDMLVEVQELPHGRLLTFNGTTEWALDSVPESEVLWLPREDQLRGMLGPAFVALEAVPGGYVVVVDLAGDRSRHLDLEAEDAYARALLAVLPQPS
jgi:hypothetical protein